MWWPRFLWLLFITFPCLLPRSGALMDPGKWQGRISPRLAHDPYRIDFHRDLGEPEALANMNAWDETMTLLPGLDIPQATIDMIPNLPITQVLMGEVPLLEGQPEGSNLNFGRRVPQLGTPIEDYEPLSESEQRLFTEGQRLWETMVVLRSKLAAQPSLFGTPEGTRLLDELAQLQKSLESVKNDLKQTAKPVVDNLIAQINTALEPLKGLLQSQSNELAGNFLGKLAGVILSPVFATALKNIQVVSGVVALAEIVHVTSRITASCSNVNVVKSPAKRALLHMQRAENGLASASSVLDRIMNDVLARRPVERADVHMFGIEQHDVSVQLANVRSQLDTARGSAMREARRHSSKAKRWALAAGALAATTHVANMFTGLIGTAATGAVASAAAANAASAMRQGRVLSETEALQLRHDDAASQHAGLQAQFNEATREVFQDEHVEGTAQRVRANKLPAGQEGWVPAEHMVAEGKLQGDASTEDDRERQRADVLSVLRELAQTSMANSTSAAVAQSDAPVHALLNQLGLGQASSATTNADGVAVNTDARVGNALGSAEGSDAGEAQARRTPRPSSLRPPSRTGTATTPTPALKPSQLRPPSVGPHAWARAATTDNLATPPPHGQGQSIHRPSALRVPSSILSATPGPSLQQTPPGPRSSIERRETRSPRAMMRQTQTPDAHSGDAGGRTSHVSLADNAIGRKLEEQLLQLLHTRMDVTTDESKKEELRVLASQLRQATRAARQQVRACQRTEVVLQDCMDPALRHRIMDAQQEATKRTQEAMRECLQATMVALEEEYHVSEQSGAGLAQDKNLASKVAATLEDARAVLWQSATPGPHTNQTSAAPTSDSPVDSRKGAALEQFMRRQAAAAARNIARRTASAEASTPGAVGGDRPANLGSKSPDTTGTNNSGLLDS